MSALAALAAVALLATDPGATTAAPATGAPGTPQIFQEIGIVEKLNDPIPTALVFKDSTGVDYRLSELFQGDKPVILTLVYYRCPMLCDLVLSGMIRSLKASGMKLGTDYRAITVSIDPTETPQLAAEKKRGYLQALGESAETRDWVFLTGGDEEIKALAGAVGFRYAYDAQLKQYAHQAVSFELTPEGKLSRYLYGIDPQPRDLRLSLIEAAGGRVGTSFDRVMLTCYRYDPATRKYGFYVKGFLRLGGFLVFAGLAGMLAVFWRREVKRGTVG